MNRRGSAAAGPPTRERIQKVLAARGVGSRRQIEAWIKAGRISVNGKLAEPGQPVGARDDIRLDGRKLRQGREEDAVQLGLAYHRPALEGIRASADATTPSSLERLPKSAGRRWIPVSPLAANDAGLELFVTDGQLATALMRRGHEISCEYSVRVRGAFDETAIAVLLASAAGDRQFEGRLTGIESAGGEGTNRWAQVRCVGLRPRDLRQLFERCGLDANRILRTHFGPIAMDRVLARGRSRSLTEGELRALAETAGMQREQPRQPSVRARPATASRKPRR